jgi:hypothetical protein
VLTVVGLLAWGTSVLVLTGLATLVCQPREWDR